MNNLIIIGADVSGMNIFEIVNDINKVEKEWKIISYFDEYSEDKELFDIPISNSLDEICENNSIKPENTYVISAIGSPFNRERLMINAKKTGFKLATIIHPTALISQHTSIGEGVIICQNCLVQPFAIIDNFVYIHTGCVIGPKVNIRSSVTINSLCAISAKVVIGEQSYIGVGTKIIQNVKIGKCIIAGGGSIITKDVESNVLVAGVPAKIKKENINGN